MKRPFRLALAFRGVPAALFSVLLGVGIGAGIGLVPGSPAPARAGEPDPGVASFVEAWRAAWESGNPEEYAGFYHPDFRTQGLDREGWLDYKRKLFYRSGTIRVRIEDLATEEGTEGRITARFRQQYESQVLRDYGTKTLEIARTPEGLRILREEWSPLPLETAPGFVPSLAPRINAPSSRAPSPPAVPAAPEAPPARAPEAGGEPEAPRTPFVPSLAPTPLEEPRPAPPEGAEDATPTTPIPGEKRVVEEIVARVNEQIITKSEYDERRGEVHSGLEMEYQGDELYEKLRRADASLVDDLVNSLLLQQRAQDLGVNINRLVDEYIQDLKRQNNVQSDEEFERMLAREGMTMDDLRARVRRTAIPQELVYQEVGAKIAVLDSDVEAYYGEHPEEFQVPPRVRIREIVLLLGGGSTPEEVEKAAEGLAERARAGEDFADLARRFSDAPTAKDGGEVGFVHRGDMAPTLERAAFNLPVGATSEPIRTENGFHVLRVEEKADTSVRPLEEVREAIRTKLADRLYEDRLREYLDRLRRTNQIEINEKYAGAGPRASAGASE